MKQIQLGEVLTEEQIEAVLDIVQTWPDDSVIRVRKLKEYLCTFRDRLEKKGVVPEYLALVIEFQLANIIKQQVNPARN